MGWRWREGGINCLMGKFLLGGKNVLKLDKDDYIYNIMNA